MIQQSGNKCDTASGCLNAIVVFVILGAWLPTGVNSEEVPLLFRHVYVPAQDSRVWPRDGETYIPIEVTELQALIRDANAAVENFSRGVSITHAEYRARWDGGRLINGQAILDVNADADTPGLLTLDTRAIAIEQPRWLNDPSWPVDVGTWGAVGMANDRFGITVPGSGQLAFGWRPVPARFPRSGSMTLRLPDSPARTLVLDIPSNKRPLVPGGAIVDKVEKVPESGRNSAQVFSDSSDVQEDREVAEDAACTRWTIALPRAGPVLLDIEDAGRDSPVISPSPTYRQHLRYRLGIRGINISATLTFDSGDKLPAELVILLDRQLQLTSVREGDTELKWQFRSGNPSQGAEVVIGLVQDESHGERTLLLEAWAPIALGQDSILPILRPVGMFWSNGKFDITVDDAIELVEVVPGDKEGAIQTEVVFAEDAAGPVKATFVQLLPSATLQVHVRPQPEHSIARLLTHVKLQEREFSAEAIAEFRRNGSDQHLIEADVPPPWSIESVTSKPLESIRDWYIERQGEKQVLNIRLMTGLSPSRPLQLIVRGQRLHGDVTQPVQLGQLRMFVPRNAMLEQDWMRLSTDSDNDIRIQGSVSRLNPTELARIHAAEGPDPRSGTTIDLLTSSPDGVVSIRPVQTQSTAEVEISINLDQHPTTVHYRFRCQPHGGSSDPLRLVFSEPLPAKLWWRDSKTGQRLVAKPASTGTFDTPVDNLKSQIWELFNLHNNGQPFQFEATLTIGSRGDFQIPLAGVLGVSRQTGKAVLQSQVGQQITFEHEGLRAALPPPSSNAGTPHCVTAFRYDPTMITRPEGSPFLSILPQKTPSISSRSLFRWVDVTTIYSGGDLAVHLVRLEMGQTQQEQLVLRLPKGARLDSASIDDMAVAMERPSQHDPDGSGEVVVPPLSREVTLRYAVPVVYLGGHASLQPPLPKGDFSLLAGHWTIWSPSNFTLSGDNFPDGFVSQPQTAIPDRLSARLDRKVVFDPFHWRRWSIFPAGGTVQANSNPRPTTNPETSPPVFQGAGTYSLFGQLIEDRFSSSGGQKSLGPPLDCHVSRIAFGPEGPPIVTLVQSEQKYAIALAALLCGIASGFSAERKHVPLLIATLGFCIALYFLLPDSYRLIVTALAGGIAIGFLLGFARLEFGGRNRIARGVSVSSGVVGPLIAIGMFLIICPASGRADEAFKEQTAASKSGHHFPVFQILVPNDDQHQPVGTKHFVSESLLRELSRRSRHVRAQTAAWRVEHAHYLGGFDPLADDGQIKPTPWWVSLDIEVLARDVQVRLPFHRNQANWGELALVDGTPIALQWADDSLSCTLFVAEPGSYRVRIPFLPQEHVDHNHVEWVLNVVRVPDTRLELSLPEASPVVEIFSADAPVPVARVTASCHVGLGSTDQIRLRRVARHEVVREAQQIMDEMFWLHATQQGVKLLVQYVAQGERMQPADLQLSSGPALQLLNPARPGNFLATAESPDAGSGLQFPFDSQNAKAGQSILTFDLTDSETYGRYRLPTFHSVHPLGRRRLAISCDPSIECRVGGESGAATMEIERFLADWGAAAAKPQTVYEASVNGSSWQLTLLPRWSEPVVEETLSMIVDTKETQLRYQASIIPGRGDQFFQRLRIPKDLEVDEVNANCQGATVPVHWVRRDEQTLMVFFGHPLSREYQLAVNGRVAVPDHGPFAMPRMHVSRQSSQRQRVFLYRRDDTELSYELVEGVSEESDLTNTASEIADARLAGTFWIDNGFDGTVPLSVSTNTPNVTGQSLITLHHDAVNGSWSASWKCRLRVNEGVLGSFHVQLPHHWLQTIESQTDLMVVTDQENDRSKQQIDDDSLRKVQLRLVQQVQPGDSVTVELRGPLVKLPGRGIEVPTIDLPGVRLTDRYVAVPGETNSQPAKWTRVGVDWVSDLPETMEPLQSVANPLQVFQIVDDAYQVRLQPSAFNDVQASISLADVRVVENTRGAQLIYSRFVIQPHGVSEVELVLPEDQTLVETRLAFVPPLLNTVARHRWILPLASGDLPQFLEVVTHRPPARKRHGDLARAILVAKGDEIPVELTLWSFATLNFPVEPVGRTASVSDPINFSLLQLSHYLRTVEASIPQVRSLPHQEAMGWAEAWSHVLGVAHDQARQAIGNLSNVEIRSQVPAQVSPSDLLNDQAKRIDAWRNQVGLPDESAGFSNSSSESLLAFSRISDEQAVPTYFIAKGGPHLLPVCPKTPPLLTRIGNPLAAFGVVFLTIGAIWLVRIPAVMDWLLQWRPLPLVIIGLAWMLFLTPSLLGLVIALLGLALFCGKVGTKRDPAADLHSEVSAKQRNF